MIPGSMQKYRDQHPQRRRDPKKCKVPIQATIEQESYDFLRKLEENHEMYRSKSVDYCIEFTREAMDGEKYLMKLDDEAKRLFTEFMNSQSSDMTEDVAFCVLLKIGANTFHQTP
ncbi:hypothetical protein ES703_87222 [subsurface metagenome]